MSNKPRKHQALNNFLQEVDGQKHTSDELRDRIAQYFSLLIKIDQRNKKKEVSKK